MRSLHFGVEEAFLFPEERPDVAIDGRLRRPALVAPRIEPERQIRIAAVRVNRFQERSTSHAYLQSAIDALQ